MDDSPSSDSEISQRQIRDKLSRIEASDILIPRSEVVLINSESPFEEILDTVIYDGHSRFPVYSERIDNIIGFLYVKDLLPLIRTAAGTSGFSIREALRKPLFISENKNLGDLFSEFISTHVHMAIVADEYGSLIGLITLEDILEQIVGEISDEYDKEEEANYKVISSKQVIVYPKMPLEEFNRVFHTRIQSDDYDTIGGFIMDTLGHVPKENETMKYKNLDLVIVKAAGSRILEIRVDR